MPFNSYEELMSAVEKRRSETLTLEVDMGSEFSQEYEEAKKELARAKAIKTLAGDKQFLSDNISALEAKAESLKPQGNPVWIRFSKLPINDWAALVKQQSITPIDQYEKILPKTFIGIYGTDPNFAEVEPLSTDHRLVSSEGDRGILSGGMMNQVMNTFMAWQNTGGDITIRPTKSGQD